MSVNNTEDLKTLFRIENDDKIYKKFTPLTDAKAGFSVRREYPQNIDFFPLRKANGEPVTVALIKVVCREFEKQQPASKAPVFLSISPYDEYLADHYDYNFEDKNGPTKESVERSRASKKPMGLESSDAYFMDIETGQIFDSKGGKLHGRDVLDLFFDQHCDTVHFWRGLALRWKVSSKDGGVKFLEIVIQFLSWLLKCCCGREFKPKGFSVGIFKPYAWDDMRLLAIEKLNVLGYTASKNAVVTFAVLFLIFYRFFDFGQGSVSSLLSICIVVVSLAFLETLFPWSIFLLINFLINKKRQLLFLKIKI